MVQMFAGRSDGGSWPLSKIIAALNTQYGSPELLGEEGPLQVYGVQDNGLNFVVAVLQSPAGSGKVVELGFLARFVGFPVDVQVISDLNRNLHISVASLEGGELFLMAGVQVSGKYDQKQFVLLLEAWRRDLTMTMHGISGEGRSLSEAFPAARMAAAVRFATNAAPSGEGASPRDILSTFLGDKGADQEICEDCGGRGKRGLIARMCVECDGTGFVANSRR